jgi:hypothetical protein
VTNYDDDDDDDDDDDVDDDDDDDDECLSSNFKFQFSSVRCFRKVLGIKKCFGNLTRLLITESAGPCGTQ